MTNKNNHFKREEYQEDFTIVGSVEEEKFPYFKELLKEDNYDTETEKLLAFQIPAFTDKINCISSIIKIISNSITDSSDVSLSCYGYFSSLLSHEEETTYEQLQFILKCMRTKKYAPVAKRTTGQKRIDKKKRLCRRITFGKDTVSSLEEYILPILEKNIERTVGDKIFIDPTHCDILFYEQGGVFKQHKDKVNTFPYPKKNDGRWRMYTCIIGLDSNLEEMSLTEDGNTCVYLPSNSTAIAWEIDGRLYSDYSDCERLLSRHLFAEGCIQGGLLVFPSESLHASRKIMQKNGYKLALKLDVWIHIEVPSKDLTVNDFLQNDIRYDSLHFNMKETRRHLQCLHKLHCHCRCCDPNKLGVKDLSKKLKSIFKNVPVSVIKIISEFTENLKSQFDNNYICDCFCDIAPQKRQSIPKINCICTCVSCVSIYKCSGRSMFDEYSDIESDIELDDYDDCNAYSSDDE